AETPPPRSPPPAPARARTRRACPRRPRPPPPRLPPAAGRGSPAGWYPPRRRARPPAGRSRRPLHYQQLRELAAGRAQPAGVDQPVDLGQHLVGAQLGELAVAGQPVVVVLAHHLAAPPAQ